MAFASASDFLAGIARLSLAYAYSYKLVLVAVAILCKVLVRCSPGRDASSLAARRFFGPLR